MNETTEQYLARGGQITRCNTYASVESIPESELKAMRERLQLDRHKESIREYQRKYRAKTATDQQAADQP
jgi:hypothetical protein